MKSDIEKKKLRSRAMRNRRALLNEKRKFGCYDDGGGKRYTIGIDFVAAGANKDALEHFRWFDSEFSDDVGEPVFLLFWALAEYRASNTREARRRLKIAMVSNLYMLPHVIGLDQKELGIWHSSNWEEPEYLDMVAAELSEPSEEERSWIQDQYESVSFRLLRLENIAVYEALLHERDRSRRSKLLDSWRQFETKHCASGA